MRIHAPIATAAVVAVFAAFVVFLLFHREVGAGTPFSDIDELLSEVRVDRHVADAGHAFTASGEAESWADTVAHMGRGCDHLSDAVNNAYGAMKRSLSEARDSCAKARDAAARFDLEESMEHSQAMLRTMQEAAQRRVSGLPPGNRACQALRQSGHVASCRVENEYLDITVTPPYVSCGELAHQIAQAGIDDLRQDGWYLVVRDDSLSRLLIGECRA